MHSSLISYGEVERISGQPSMFKPAPIVSSSSVLCSTLDSSEVSCVEESTKLGNHPKVLGAERVGLGIRFVNVGALAVEKAGEAA